MKIKSRQPHSRQENGVGRANRLRSTLNLAASPGFGHEYGEWTPGGNPVPYFVYNHLGYEVRLRFSQVTYEWTARAPKWGIETQFPHQPPQDIQRLLNEWIFSHIDQSVSSVARLRQERPTVQNLATRHDISIRVADEMMRSR